MSTSTLPAELETTDEAFLSAMTPKRLGNIELQPYTLFRQLVALEITGKESSPILDAVVNVWACTVEEIELAKSRRDKDAAIVDAFNWAHNAGYRLGNMKPLIDVFNEINAELATSMRVLSDGKDNGESKNDGGRQQ